MEEKVRLDVEVLRGEALLVVPALSRSEVARAVAGAGWRRDPSPTNESGSLSE